MVSCRLSVSNCIKPKILCVIILTHVSILKKTAFLSAAPPQNDQNPETKTQFLQQMIFSIRSRNIKVTDPRKNSIQCNYMYMYDLSRSLKIWNLAFNSWHLILTSFRFQLFQSIPLAPAQIYGSTSLVVGFLILTAMLVCSPIILVHAVLGPLLSIFIGMRTYK